MNITRILNFNQNNSFLNFNGRKPVDITKENLESVISSHPEYSLNKIGDVLGVSGVTIKKLITNFGIDSYEPKKNIPQGDISKEALEKIIKQNPQYTQSKIGTCYGVTSTTIAKWINRYNVDNYKIKHNNKPVILTKEELESFVKENPKCTLEKIAEHFNTSISTALRRIRKYNIDYKG